MTGVNEGLRKLCVNLLFRGKKKNNGDNVTLFSCHVIVKCPMVVPLVRNGHGYTR